MNYLNNINKYFPSVEQTIFAIIIKKFTDLKSDLYTLPLFTAGLAHEDQIKT